MIKVQIILITVLVSITNQYDNIELILRFLEKRCGHLDATEFQRRELAAGGRTASERGRAVGMVHEKSGTRMGCQSPGHVDLGIGRRKFGFEESLLQSATEDVG